MAQEIRPLTGLRGVAACWVVACHWAGPELRGIPRAIALHGYVAVDLFMVLSGFVLALTYVPRMQSGLWSGHGRFIWQRFVRLYPLYALTTLVCLAEAAWTGTDLFAPGGGPPLPALASNLLMTTTHLWPVDAIDGPSWSISVEFTLNLAFPLFVLACTRLSWRVGTVVGAFCAATLVMVSVLDQRLNGGAVGALGTLDNRLMYLRCGPEFALGMLCWRVWRDCGWAVRLAHPAWMTAIGLAMLATTPFKALDLPFVALCCLLVVGLTAGGGWIGAALGSPVPHWLGTISFSLYLWHAALLPLRPAWIGVLPIADPDHALMVANTLNLALVLALATLSYHWFEVTVRQWLRPLLPALRPHPA
jgi:peptidoglycan/LPS O-acetylase OafA/YrhL